MGQKQKKRRQAKLDIASFALRLALQQTKHLLQALRVCIIVSFSGFAPAIFACLLNRKFSEKKLSRFFSFTPHSNSLRSDREWGDSLFLLQWTDGRELAHPCLGGEKLFGLMPGCPLHSRL